MNLDEPLAQQLRDNWPLPRHQARDLLAVHFVPFPPTTIGSADEQLYLLELNDDRFTQVHTDDVLVLFSLSFTAPDSVKTQKIRVLWSPKRVTRELILTFLRLRWFCEQPETLCMLYLNNIHWPAGDAATRSLESGDHVRVQIRSERIHWTDLEYSEDVECSRRIFASSPRTFHPQPAESVEDERAGVSPSTARSRSIGTGMSRKGMKQNHLKTMMKSRHRSSSRGRSLGDSDGQGRGGYAEDPDVTTPQHSSHVFDRWCRDGTSELDCVRQPSPVPIELAQALEPASPPGQLPVGLDFRPVAHFLELLDCHLLLTCFDFTAPLGWRYSSYDWLAYPWWDVDEPLQEIHIYTDGSSREEGTGAAFIAFGLQWGRWKLMGSFSQTLPSHWEAHHAEDLALWYATKFLYDVCRMTHHRGFQLPGDMVCHFDSMVAGGKAFGHYTAHTHVTCAHTTRCMIQLCETAFRTNIRGQHVKGHRGDPGNEAANTLAEAAACGSPTHSYDPLLASIAAGDFEFEFSWMWALFYQPFATFWHDLQLHLPLTGTRSSPYTGLSSVPHEPLKEEEFGKAHLQIATANVLTLKPKLPGKRASEDVACGLGSTSNQDAFFKQCHEEGIHLLACQETRLKRGPRGNEWYFFRHSPATDHGCYGITVAFSTQIPIGVMLAADGIEVPVFWKDKDISVIAKNPRFLLLRSTNTLCRAIIVAAHAPHMRHTEQDIEQWWTGLRKQIPDSYHDWRMLFLGDANAHVGSQTSTAVGDHLPEEEHPRAATFMIHSWTGTPSSHQRFWTFRRVRQVRGTTPSRKSGREEIMLHCHVVGLMRRVSQLSVTQLTLAIPPPIIV